MNLASVQSRINRLAIVEESESGQEFFQVICKTFVRKHFAVFAYYQTTTKEFALKAAEKWLEGAK